ERLLRPADLDAELARLDREALALGRMDVRGRDGAVRLDDGLDHDRVAVGVGRRGEERDALAGDRVVDRVACADHSGPPVVSWLTPRMLAPRLPKIVGRRLDFGLVGALIFRRRGSSARGISPRPAGRVPTRMRARWPGGGRGGVASSAR